MKENLTRDFISEEPRRFRFKIGKYLASSLSGFIAGVIVGSMIWIAIIIVLRALS